MKAIQILFEESFSKSQLNSQAVENGKGQIHPKTWKRQLLPARNLPPNRLTSILGKCMERIVNSGLYAFAEHHALLDKEKEGFREKKGTTYALLRLIKYL